MTNKQPEALRLAGEERLNVGVHSQSIFEEYSEAARELRRQYARIVELEKENRYLNGACAELKARIVATQQSMDAQTIKHISALSELVRMPNAEYFADAHNAAVRHLRALATQSVKQGESND